MKRRRVALEQQLERMSLTDEEKLEERQRLARKEKEFSRLQRHQMTADDFDKLAIVGRGAFGEVRIVREKATGKLYAMKKLKKSDTVRRNQVCVTSHPSSCLQIFLHQRVLLNAVEVCRLSTSRRSGQRFQWWTAHTSSHCTTVSRTTTSCI